MDTWAGKVLLVKGYKESFEPRGKHDVFSQDLMGSCMVRHVERCNILAYCHINVIFQLSIHFYLFFPKYNFCCKI
jgi:hypothetical protein